MKQYITPQLLWITLDFSDILTASAGQEESETESETAHTPIELPMDKWD